MPVQHTLTHLYLSHNALQNASRDILPEMHLLQLLDLSHNKLTDIEFDALRSARHLQVRPLCLLLVHTSNMGKNESICKKKKLLDNLCFLFT